MGWSVWTLSVFQGSTPRTPPSISGQQKGLLPTQRLLGSQGSCGVSAGGSGPAGDRRLPGSSVFSEPPAITLQNLSFLIWEMGLGRPLSPASQSARPAGEGRCGLAGPLACAAPLLARAPAPEVCAALNVTVSPGPVVDYLEGQNATLLCHVSQKRRKDSLLAVRWFFAHSSNSQEALMVKMTKLRMVQYYGNFSRSAKRQRLRLLEEQRGTLYRLSVLTLQPSDQGHYVCKVQEISRHRNKWTAWSNGSSATEMRVISLKASEESSFEKTKETWAFFEDIYVYAVLVCCVGILSILLFMLVIIWQSVFNKRKSRVRHYLVKCPQNSSGETVTSVTSLAPLQPKKGKRQKEKPDIPPAVPAKAPIAPTFHKPKLLKPQRKVTLPKIAEENLTYAELELIKPHQAAKGAPTSTVYAQILFEENKL
ncbi:PREDICTED: V-set and transmembrane domain-containing protein 4 [Cercocebus atys]|uniref:V-set and transmembrane domain-containing protein 4 n=1 Tax=Cercocebus atys TaxID=9531 RepID=UPI0005F46C00|nr:PREDICTED: V-set and transmembrane domain-containing protein 4 [Cercocebus atys]